MSATVPGDSQQTPLRTETGGDALTRQEDQTRVGVIDDDQVILLSCTEILRRQGYQVETFDNGEAGIRRIEEAPPSLVVVDLKMPKLDGFQVIQRIREIDPGVVMVVITGYATIATAVDAMKAGAYDFLPKPFTPEELRLIVGRGFERWRLARESTRLRREKEILEHRFITFVSHQLKEPLVAVEQYLSVLLHTTKADLPDRAREWIARSQMRLREMTSLIEDWLALSCLERGELSRSKAWASLDEVVGSVVQAEEPHAAAAEVALRSELPATLPPVRGDAKCLSMLVHNLVSNAVKYNRRGGAVTLGAMLRGSMVSLEVSDTGLGIGDDALPRLFQEFYRVRTPATRDIPGTGLGLAICKKIVSELGGRIEVRSKEGSGSTFTVLLPISEECESRGSEAH
jgi:signal transduction histidine kinase